MKTRIEYVTEDIGVLYPEKIAGILNEIICEVNKLNFPEITATELMVNEREEQRNKKIRARFNRIMELPEDKFEKLIFLLGGLN